MGRRGQFIILEPPRWGDLPPRLAGCFPGDQPVPGKCPTVPRRSRLSP